MLWFVFMSVCIYVGVCTEQRRLFFCAFSQERRPGCLGHQTGGLGAVRCDSGVSRVCPTGKCRFNSGLQDIQWSRGVGASEKYSTGLVWLLVPLVLLKFAPSYDS